MFVNEVQEIELGSHVAAVFTEDSKNIFDYEDITTESVKEGLPKMVPWGEDNDLPELMLEKIRASDVMSPNMLFNVQVAYGTGLAFTMNDGTKVKPDIKTFFKRNKPVKFLLEQFTDLKHFSFSVAVILLTKDGEKIARIKHKEAYHCRLSENNSKTGKIEYVYFSNWDDDTSSGDNVVDYPLLDMDDPAYDLLVRMGREPDPATGKKQKQTTDRAFAIITRIPTPGRKYYPFPYYASFFNSGWYDIGVMVPLAKKAKMKNGMAVKYHVEIHRDYFPALFEDEKISDPEKQKTRREKEFQNIKTFLTGIENSGKIWWSGYYIDPNGHENHMVKINVLDNGKEGGDWIEDAENAISMGCYAMNVHPSLIGAVPGKSKGSFSGTDKRELFTMKQTLECSLRALMLIPYQVIQEYNKWPEELEFEIPDMMLTTLDAGTDATEVTQITESNDSNND